MGCACFTDDTARTEDTNRTTMYAVGAAVSSGAEQFSDLDDDEEELQLPEPNMTFGGFLGRGSHCCVVWAIETSTGRRIAIKRGMKKTVGADALLLESKLLQRLGHPHIVEYYDFKVYPTEVCLYEEYMSGGSLQQMIDALPPGGMSLDAMRKFSYQLLLGLQYIHARSIVHCDVKSSNILIDADGNTKLSDFGSAVVLNSDGEAVTARQSRLAQDNQRCATRSLTASWRWDNAGLRGTAYWMAPELLGEDRRVSTAVDIWSLGATVVEMLTGKPLFFALGPIPAMTKIARLKHVEGRCPLKLPENVDPVLADFLTRTFVVDPEKRPSATELLQHPWVAVVTDEQEAHSL